MGKPSKQIAVRRARAMGATRRVAIQGASLLCTLVVLSLAGSDGAADAAEDHLGEAEVGPAGNSIASDIARIMGLSDGAEKGGGSDDEPHGNLGAAGGESKKWFEGQV